MKVLQRTIRSGKGEIIEVKINSLTLYMNGSAIIGFIAPGSCSYEVSEDVWEGRMNRPLLYFTSKDNRTPRTDFLNQLEKLGVDVSNQKKSADDRSYMG